MRIGRPPVGVAPEVLFRRLLEFPRPSAPVDVKFHGFEHKLTATALSAIEVSKAEEAKGEAALAEIIARSLRADGLLVFDAADDLLDLREAEYNALVEKFFEAFCGICPLRGRCDYGEWTDVLIKGANHVSNVTPTKLLGACYEAANVGKHIRILDRPEAYWGCAPAELLDGHLLCHSVARKIHEQRYGSV